MTNFKDFLAEQLQNPIVKKEWDALQPQLSQCTGIAQSDISRLETGNANPSLRTLQRLAAGMDMTLKIEFVPVEKDASSPET